MEDESHPCIRLEKKDLYMFLARLMEESPECHAPSDEFNKTGIVICESDKVHKLVAMSFSKPGLHAVQHIILCLPFSLRDCTVYLSRKPCTSCTTFLIQGSVSSVYYWPMAPEKKGDDSVVEEDTQQADCMFLGSHISSSVLLPMTSFETVKMIAKKTRCKGQPNSNFRLFSYQAEDFEKYCSLFNVHSCKDTYVKRMENALRCYDFLLECSQLEKKELKENVHRHALQLCYFLAARSDDPNRGVGCALYSQDGYFFGAGYNGYPIGILYANLPSAGRKKRITELAKREVVVHAEANALIYRSKSKIEESDVLYCIKPPCRDCQNLLKDVKIKTIHCVQESSKQSENDHLDDLKKNFDYHEWKQCETQLMAVPSDSEDSVGTEGMNDEGTPIPFLKKEDLCIFLALHMENLPSESQESHCKTGVVVCEPSKPKRIIALACSTKELHAVAKVLLRFPNALKGCEVYMSRKPCNYCAKLLVQAQVSQVYYWPNIEIKMAKGKSDPAKHANAIFTGSYVVAAVCVPTIANQRKMQILNSNEKASSNDDLVPVSSIFDEKIDADILKEFNLEHLKEDQLKKYKENLTTAKDCFKSLASCKDEKIIILEEKESVVKNNPKYTHALQLCDLLASRSDNNNGVGTVIYKEDNIVALGYSGYPKGAMTSLFCKKADVDFYQHAIVCAEANAIIMSSERDLCNAELITTREPCHDCLKLIRAKNIAKVIWPLRDRNRSGGLTEDPSGVI